MTGGTSAWVVVAVAALAVQLSGCSDDPAGRTTLSGPEDLVQAARLVGVPADTELDPGLYASDHSR